MIRTGIAVQGPLVVLIREKMCKPAEYFISNSRKSARKQAECSMREAITIKCYGNVHSRVKLKTIRGEFQ